MHGTPLASTLSAHMHSLPHPLRAPLLSLFLAGLFGCATAPELDDLVYLHRAGAHDAALELLAEEDVQVFVFFVGKIFVFNVLFFRFNQIISFLFN